MKPGEIPAQDKPADEYTGNYGRGGYYGYTYDQEAYNRQVKKASQAKEVEHRKDIASGEKET